MSDPFDFRETPTRRRPRGRGEGPTHAEAWRLVPLVCAAIFLIALLLALAAGGVYLYHLWQEMPPDRPPAQRR